MAYNTGNPVGSSDFRDLSDNAVNFDKYSVGTDPAYPNRLGVLKLSIEGMNQEFNNAQDGRSSQFNADQATRASQFELALAAVGFVWIGDYGTGLNFTTRSQYTVRDGIAYVVANGTTLPYTATGNWATEVSKFKALSSDQILRTDLGNSVDLAKGAAIVARSTQVIDSVEQLKTFNPGVDKKLVYLRGYYAELPGKGGGYFCWDASSTTTETTEGRYIAVAGLPTGRWVRPADNVTPECYGAKGDGVADDVLPLNASIAYNKSITSESGASIYRVTDTVVVNNNNRTILFNKATIHLDDGTGIKNTIKLGDGATQKYGITLERMVLTRAQVATAGSAIDGDYVGVVNINDVNVYGDNKVFNGLNIRRGIIVNLTNSHIQAPVNRGIILKGTGLVADRTVDFTGTGNRVEGGVTGLDIGDFVEGIFWKNNIIYNTSGTGCTVVGSSLANGLSSFKFQNSDFDTCGGAGLYMNNVGNFQVTGCWFSGVNASNGSTINIGPGCDGGVISANQCYGRAGAINTRIEGQNIAYSGNLVLAGSDGIYLGPTAGVIGLTGNVIGLTSTYCINAYSAPTGGWSESGNEFKPTSGLALGIGSGNVNFSSSGSHGGGLVLSTAWAGATIAAGGAVGVTITAAEAQLGDKVDITYSGSLAGTSIFAAISATGQIAVEVRNPTGGSITLGAGTLRTRISRFR